jgi:hypothetical protein
MDCVLEILVQKSLNGLEDILLKFQSQISCDNFHRIKEPSKIWENDLFGNFITEIQDLEEICLGDFIENISKFQEDLYEDSFEEFFSCYEDIFPSPPGPTKVVQYTIKGEGIQRKKRLHRSPLNLKG